MSNGANDQVLGELLRSCSALLREQLTPGIGANRYPNRQFYCHLYYILATSLISLDVVQSVPYSLIFPSSLYRPFVKKCIPQQHIGVLHLKVLGSPGNLTIHIALYRVSNQLAF